MYSTDAKGSRGSNCYGADRISPWYRSAAWMVGMFKSSRILFKPRVARREDNQFASLPVVHPQAGDSDIRLPTDKYRPPLWRQIT
jgi:hypothetical protein